MAETDDVRQSILENVVAQLGQLRTQADALNEPFLASLIEKAVVEARHALETGPVASRPGGDHG